MKYFFIVFSFLYFNSSAQKCVIDSTQWEKVEMRLIESRKEPPGFKLKGEGIIKTHAGVITLEDLTANEVKQIKLKAATYGGCIVFIDLADAYGSVEFPTRKANKLYFYFGYFK